MQRQPEICNIFENEDATTTTKRGSITVENLAAAAESDRICRKMAFSSSAGGAALGLSLGMSDSFDIETLLDTTEDHDNNSNKNKNSATSKSTGHARRRSSLSLNRSMIESFACSFASILTMENTETSTKEQEDSSPVTFVTFEDESSSSSSSSSSSEGGDHQEVISIHDLKAITEADVPMSALLDLVTGPSTTVPDAATSVSDTNNEDQDQQTHEREHPMPPPRPVSICSSISSTTTSTSTASGSSSLPNGIVTTIDGNTETMDQPTVLDVVCGRNSASYNCVGNRRFRVSVEMNVDRYMAAPTREEKTRVVQQLATTLMDEVGCRFLKKTGKNQFVEMDRKQVKDKIGHSFRDLVNLRKKGGVVNHAKKNNKTSKAKATTRVSV